MRFELISYKGEAGSDLVHVPAKHKYGTEDMFLSDEKMTAYAVAAGRNEWGWHEAMLAAADYINEKYPNEGHTVGLFVPPVIITEPIEAIAPIVAEVPVIAEQPDTTPKPDPLPPVTETPTPTES